MSFRRYGGLNYSARNNIVSNNYNTTNQLSVTNYVGQPNSHITFESNIVQPYNSSEFVYSDYRIKSSIKTLEETFIDKLNPVTYVNNNTGKQDIGLIAHELQNVYPFLVKGEKDGKELQQVNYIGLIPILIKEIQELKKRINELSS